MKPKPPRRVNSLPAEMKKKIRREEEAEKKNGGVKRL